ncbi:MAG: hypothetical protein KC444_06980 [Nitrosopumilus sp.]|nr:hypothetical protein [Nitrosopumilus sp.]
MNSYHVSPNVRESEFLNLKGILKERYRMNNKPIQPGTREALEVDTPNGKITITYYKNGKLMVQSSPSNPEYVLLVDDITEYFSNLKKNQNI